MEDQDKPKKILVGAYMDADKVRQLDQLAARNARDRAKEVRFTIEQRLRQVTEQQAA